MKLQRVQAEQVAAWLTELKITGDIDPLGRVDSGLGSPLVVAEATAMRNSQRRELPLLTTVDCDLHVLGIGEPACRYATKIGGLPYRPAAWPWPMSADGTPYSFLCQFNIRESADILVACPGDILLVFSKDTRPVLSADENELYFEWHRAGHDDDVLLASLPVPADSEAGFLGFGVALRTFDFLDPEPLCSWFCDRLGEDEWRSIDVAYKYSVSRFRGLKLGGLPCWVGAAPPDDWGNGYSPSQREYDSLAYLGGFGSVFPEPGRPWPWINRELPLTPEFSSNEWLPWFDGFQWHIFLDSSKELRWTMELF